MKCIKLILLSVIFLLSVSLVDAAKITQDFKGTVGYEVRTNLQDYIVKEGNLTIDAHIYNLSDGLIVTNDSASCLVHIYNQVGDHLAEEQMVFDGMFDFELTLDGNNFTENKVYSYIINCNSTNLGGFVSGEIQATDNGKLLNDNIDYLVFFGIIFLIFFFVYFAFKLDDKHYLLRILFLMVSLVCTLLIPQLLYNNYNSSFIQILRITTWTFRLFAIYMLVYLFYYWAKSSERLMKWLGIDKED